MTKKKRLTYNGQIRVKTLDQVNSRRKKKGIGKLPEFSILYQFLEKFGGKTLQLSSNDSSYVCHIVNASIPATGDVLKLYLENIGALYVQGEILDYSTYREPILKPVSIELSSREKSSLRKLSIL